MGVIDQTSEPGKQLQGVVKQELKSYLGQDYNDECLPLYIVVMLAQNTGQTAVAENLVAFLGDAKAVQFADWLFAHLAEHPGKYEVAEKVVEAAQDPAAEKQPGERAERGHKRRREKREKIEWKEEEHGRSSKHRDREGETPRDRNTREEKRRRGRDGDVRPERERNGLDGGGEPGMERDKELRRLRRREALGGGEEQSRSRREEREGRHREGERHRRPRSDDPLEREEPRRESRRGQERPSGGHVSPEKPVQQGGRLAGRIGLPGAIQRPTQAGSLPQPPREGGRGSVFDRLNRKGEDSDRTRMRMDAVPAERIDDVTVEFTPDPKSASKDQGSPQDMLEELRIIRESLAKLQANKEVPTAPIPTPALPAAAAVVGAGLRLPVDHTSALAAANARKVVVHNVHFNATPDILKAHFGGCGVIMSAIIEKDYQGNSKGQAVIEFGDEAARRTALSLSGSLLVGRPITVYAKETAPRSNPNPMGGFRPPMPAYPAPKFPPTTFRPRAPAPGRGAGRARPFLKTNKYVRPTAPTETAMPANGAS